MRFTKMHGLGNDYVVLGLDRPAGKPFDVWSRALCDRYRGVGADGLLLVAPSDTADFLMRIFNADGSEAEMCGNGIRCAVKYFLDTFRPEWKDEKFRDVRVETKSGPRVVRARCADGAVGLMTVDMGIPAFEPAAVPVNAPEERVADHPVEVDNKQLAVTCVSMGNPHAVIFFEEDVAGMDISGVGAALERHPMFPNRTNVGFANVLAPDEIRLRVWERGVGATLACGTGACAAVVAASLTGRTGRGAVVHQPGGDLVISWEADGRVLMTGPAVTVFTGEWQGEPALPGEP